MQDFKWSKREMKWNNEMKWGWEQRDTSNVKKWRSDTNYYCWDREHLKLKLAENNQFCGGKNKINKIKA